LKRVEFVELAVSNDGAIGLLDDVERVLAGRVVAANALEFEILEGPGQGVDDQSFEGVDAQDGVVTVLGAERDGGLGGTSVPNPAIARDVIAARCEQSGDD
jgi:hypothetical protein